jgi:hypothetical protein
MSTSQSRLLTVVVVLAGLVLGYLAFRPHETAPVAAPPPPVPVGSPGAAPAAVPSTASVAAELPAAPQRLHPRDPGEWQGMLVDLSRRPPCGQSARCGMALACREDGLCGPCRTDGDCAVGEGCVLDHCVPSAQVGCRRRADCAGEDAVCLLTGYSADPRGNAGMRSECLEKKGGRDRTAGEPEPHFEPAPEPEVNPTRMLDSLRDAD